MFNLLPLRSSLVMKLPAISAPQVSSSCHGFFLAFLAMLLGGVAHAADPATVKRLSASDVNGNIQASVDSNGPDYETTCTTTLQTVSVSSRNGIYLSIQDERWGNGFYTPLGANIGVGNYNAIYGYTVAPTGGSPTFPIPLTLTFVRAGTYQVSIGGHSDVNTFVNGNMRIIVQQKQTTIATINGPLSVMGGSTNSYTANATDQFSNPVALTGYAWTANGGSMTVGGQWTAPNVDGQFTLTVTAGSLSKSVLVTVTRSYDGTHYTRAGHSGTFVDRYPIMPRSGYVVVQFQMYSQPDGMTSTYAGSTIGGTGGLVSGSGSYYMPYVYNSNFPQYQVTINGNPQATDWDYVTFCTDTLPFDAIQVTATPSTVQPTGTATVTAHATKNGTVIAAVDQPAFSYSASQGSIAASSADGTTATFTPASGVYGASTITATSVGIHGTASVTVQAPWDAVTVTPTGATLSPGGTQQYSASATSAGAPVPNQPTFIWTQTGGAITSSGLFTAGSTSGGYTATASAGGVSGSASGVIHLQRKVVIVPHETSTGPGRTVPFQALVTDLANNPTSDTVTWSVSSSYSDSIDPTTGVLTVDATPLQSNEMARGPFSVIATLSTDASIQDRVKFTVYDPLRTPLFDPADLTTSSGVVHSAAAGSSPENPKDSSSDPIRYGSGEIEMYVDDIESSGFAPLKVCRSYANRRPVGSGPLGDGWALDSLPSVAQNGAALLINLNATSTFVFQAVAGSNPLAYTPQGFIQDTMATQGDELVFTDTTSNRTIFYGFTAAVPPQLRGKLKRLIDTAGNVSGTTYDASFQMTRIDRIANVNGAAVTETFQYAYRADGRLTSVSRIVGRNAVMALSRMVVFDYYTGANGENGEQGELKTAMLQDGLGNVLNRFGYRYWRVATGGGVVGLLKYVVNPRTYARLLGQGTDPITAPEAIVGVFADKYFEYDSLKRVTRQVIHGGEVDGSGTQTYAYASPATATPDAYNNWSTKTTETLADGTQNIVYCNYATQVLVHITKEAVAPNRQWFHAYQYDAQGRVVWHAAPSAVTGCDESQPNLGITTTSAFIRANAGLIETTVYGPSTTATAAAAGDIQGYLKKTAFQQGSGGIPQVIGSRTYLLHTGN